MSFIEFINRGFGATGKNVPSTGVDLYKKTERCGIDRNFILSSFI
jgi:hypothetical protein